MDAPAHRNNPAPSWLRLPTSDSEVETAVNLSAAPQPPQNLTAAERQDVEQALQQARVHGIGSLTDAVAWFVQHSKVAIALPAAVAEFNLAKRCEGIRELTLRGYRYHLEAFAAARAEMPVAAVTPEEVTDELLRWKNVTTRSNRWQDLATFFTWAVRQGYTDRNPVFQAMRKPLCPKAARCIFTPREAIEILHRTKDTQAIGYWALALFAGLRTQEIRWLHDHRDPWSLIREGIGVIDLRDQPPKTGPRVVPILPVLRPWLKWMRRHDVPFLPLDHWSVRHQLKCEVLTKRFGPISRMQEGGQLRFYNMARRSHISYRLALPNASYMEIARDVGNSELIIRKFYAQRASRADAQRYFSLTPSRV